jgi:hypothetical protein
MIAGIGFLFYRLGIPAAGLARLSPMVTKPQLRPPKDI